MLLTFVFCFCLQTVKTAYLAGKKYFEYPFNITFIFQDVQKLCLKCGSYYKYLRLTI